GLALVVEGLRLFFCRPLLEPPPSRQDAGRDLLLLDGPARRHDEVAAAVSSSLVVLDDLGETLDLLERNAAYGRAHLVKVYPLVLHQFLYKVPGGGLLEQAGDIDVVEHHQVRRNLAQGRRRLGRHRGVAGRVDADDSRDQPEEQDAGQQHSPRRQRDDQQSTLGTAHVETPY